MGMSYNLTQECVKDIVIVRDLVTTPLPYFLRRYYGKT